MNVQERVIRAIARACQLDPEQVHPEATFEELGVDSLKGLEIVFELEEEFKVSIPENVAVGMRSVRDVIERLRTVFEGAGGFATEPSS
ncbi:Acyl carrier protein [bacterium HR10]|nr:Acyl carrier protein [bacterium HR10]